VRLALACLAALVAGLLIAVPPAGATLFREVAASPEPDGAPSFSPDGQQIAFSSPMSGDWEIYTVGAWGGPLTNFTDSPGIDIYANWSHAGPWIVFTSRRDNGAGDEDMDLWLKSTVDGSEINLTRAEHEAAMRDYFDIFSNMEKKVEERTGQLKGLQAQIADTNRQLQLMLDIPDDIGLKNNVLLIVGQRFHEACIIIMMSIGEKLLTFQRILL